MLKSHMRKLLLFVILLGFSINTKAQINTVIFEDFEAPSLDDQIDSTYSVRLSNGTVSNFPFSVTNQVATSGTNSYHAQGSDGHSSFFRTISFSTINFRYTTLKFNHIAKVSNLNGCYLTVSTDGGTTWKQINGTQYRGASKAYEATGFFNESSYFTLGDPWRNGVYAGANSVPNNTWWRLETFDISDLVYDVPNNTGYPNVIVRFEMRVTQGTPSGIPPAGWFIDDLEIEQAACELTPPKLEFGFNPIPCYFYNPVGPIPEQPGDKYAVGIQAFDPSNIDSVFLYYRSTSPPGQPFQRISLPLYSPSDTLYQDTIRNVFVGDTIEYYYVGWDGSCNPNMSRMPAVAGNYYIFWPEPALPDKCGPNTCTQFPELIQLTNLPWVEDFEDQRWGAGNGGATTAGNAHRGEFPVFYPDGNWTVAPPVTAGFENRYAWCVNSGGTSTPGTGPLSNHTQGGSKYLFAESSLGSNTAVQSTQIITPCIDLTQETRCLAFEFWYHMFGEDVDLLRIDVDTGSGTANWVIEYRKILGEQQKANTDPWKRFVFPLEDFNGKYVRIRLLAAKRPGLGGPRGDIAVDDFRIFEPDPVDIEVQSLNEPKNGYCYFDNQEPVIIEVRNNGCQTATNIPVAFEVSTSTGTSAVQWDTIKTPLVLGDTLTYTFTPKADLSAYNTYWVKAWATMPGDVNTSNDMVQVRDSIEYTLPISSFPYIEDFEDGIIQSQDIGNDLMRFSDGVITFYKWLVNRGLTPSLGQSGPFEGFGYGGKYLYTRSLVNDNQSSSTYVRTVCVDLGGMTSPVIEFYYHMFGDAIESLELEVSRAEEDLDTWTPIPGSKITGAQQTGSLSDWKYKKVHLGPEYLGETIKIRFKATRKSITMPTPAHPDYVDMAIDKVMIFDEIANDAGILSINTPVLHGEAGTTFNPSIKVTNHGTANIASVPLTIKVTPLCGPNAGQSTTYTDVATASVTP
ncbi:MAG TPA: hypothetical protein DDW81_08410, partial [Cryomorphaceae bacterium]|nr:hypothetical protein [Cryomorphaceae bacterium]